MLRLALLAAVLAAPLASAQTPLAVGAPVPGTLDGSAPVTYTMTLGAGQFVAGAVDQETVDVVVVVTAPDGAELLREDGPARGAEPFQFTTDAAGAYTLSVEPFEGDAGRFTARLDLAEPVATTPEGTVRQMMAGRTGPVPGAVVGVLRDGEMVYAEAFGLANLTHGVPFTTDTPTNIGSTSKQFTGFALALLAERGALSLDDDVRAHIPELPDLGETVTLRHLAGHTSGYREFLNTLMVAGRPLMDGDPISRDEIIAIVQRQPALQNTPGTEFNYNNTGFALLAEVVARVGGAPFPEWMAENVFGPLGMTQTVVRDAPSTLVPGSAQGYVAGADGWREVPDLGASMGAGGIYTTVGDLAKWMRNLMEPTFAPGAVALLQTEGTLADGEGTGYGLGITLDEVRGQRRMQHGGADVAHRSMLAVFPDLGAGVVVLTNSDANAGAFAGRTIEAFLPEAFPDVEVVEIEAADADADAPVDFDDALFDDYAGRYALDIAPSFILTFSRGDGGGYLTQATGQGELEIVPTSDSTFVLTAVEAGVTFHRDADGVVRGATLHQGGDQHATRLDMEDADTEPRDLAAYAGRYWSDELQTAYTVAVVDGGLVATHPRSGETPLAPLAGEKFSLGPGMSIEFLPDGDAVTGFMVDAGRARGIRFDRAD